MSQASPSRWAQLWPYLVVLAVGLFVLMPKLGEFGLWDPWEPKYAETSREMSESGSYIVPFYRHEVRLTKPILVYWGILAGSAVFGLNEFGARIVGVLFAIASMLGTCYAVSVLRGRQAGLISALVLGTLPQFYLLARQAMPDVYLFTSLGICLLFFCLGLTGPEQRRNLHFVVSYVGFALALLAKGPVIICVVFFTTLAIYTVIQIDLSFFWQTERKLETVRLLATAVLTTALLAGFSVTAFLFGTSPLWWGYNESGREEMAIRRARILDQFVTFRLAEILLVLIALAAIAGAVLLFKRRKPGMLGLVGPILLAAAMLQALACLFFGSAEFKILGASSLGAAACLLLLALAVRRFLGLPWLREVVGPYVGPVLRQLALFGVVLLVVAGPWHIGILIQQGHGYFTDFILKHNVQRASETINRSGVSEFYVRVLIFGMFPWSCFIPVALASLIGWWNKNPLKRYALESYLVIAALVIFSAFTVPATKFAHYLSPMLIPMAVLIGLAIQRTLEERQSVGARLTWIVALMLYVLPARDILEDDGSEYLVGAITMKRMVPDNLAPGEYYQGLVIAIGLILLASIVVRSRALLGALLLSTALLANWTAGVFIPELSPHKSMKYLCETWKEKAQPGEPICFYGDMKHGIFFYTDYKIERLGTREAFEEFMNPRRRAFCVVERETLRVLQTSYRRLYENQTLELADESHFGYVLISNYKLASDGSAD